MIFNWNNKQHKLNVEVFLTIEELRDKMLEAAKCYKEGFLDTNGDVNYAEEKFLRWLEDEGVEQILNEDLELEANIDCVEVLDIAEYIWNRV